MRSLLAGLTLSILSPSCELPWIGALSGLAPMVMWTAHSENADDNTGSTSNTASGWDGMGWDGCGWVGLAWSAAPVQLSIGLRRIGIENEMSWSNRSHLWMISLFGTVVIDILRSASGPRRRRGNLCSRCDRNLCAIHGSGYRCSQRCCIGKRKFRSSFTNVTTSGNNHADLRVQPERRYQLYRLLWKSCGDGMTGID